MKSTSKKHSEVEIQVIMLTNAVLRQGTKHGMVFTGSGTALTTPMSQTSKKEIDCKVHQLESLIWSPLRVTQPYIPNIILVTNDPSI